MLNCSQYFKGARDKLERSKKTLEAEKAALDKQVRQLTFQLEVRMDDFSKKEVGAQDCHQL